MPYILFTCLLYLIKKFLIIFYEKFVKSLEELMLERIIYLCMMDVEEGDKQNKIIYILPHIYPFFVFV